MTTHATPAKTLLCTVGTSLFSPSNLAGLKTDDPDPVRAELAAGFAARDAKRIGAALAKVSAEERLVGAEISSNALLLSRGLVARDPDLYLFHSDTEDGRLIAETLVETYRLGGEFAHVEAVVISGLQDANPLLFRTQGLRNLAREVCRLLRERDPSSCAINATGGYKAQIAIAALMGQALGSPVYYKHERFNDIIAFPPMPIAFDFDVWLRLSGVLYALDRESVCAVEDLDFPEEAKDDLADSLFDRVTDDGREWLSLSPTGQIFHETFRHRFGQSSKVLLPPPASPDRKRPPEIEDGHTRELRGLEDFLVRLTNEAPQVVLCKTWYYNPDLPRPNKFWVSAQGLVGQYGDGRGLAKFRVESTAENDEQRLAVAAALNEWLERHGR